MEKGCQNINLNSPFVYLYCNQTIKDMAKIKDSTTGRFISDHGKRFTSEYSIWHGVKNRCTNPNVRQYKRYGGRGISEARRIKRAAKKIKPAEKLVSNCIVSGCF